MWVDSRGEKRAVAGTKAGTKEGINLGAVCLREVVLMDLRAGEALQNVGKWSQEDKQEVEWSPCTEVMTVEDWRMNPFRGSLIVMSQKARWGLVGPGLISPDERSWELCLSQIGTIAGNIWKWSDEQPENVDFQPKWRLNAEWGGAIWFWGQISKTKNKEQKTKEQKNKKSDLRTWLGQINRQHWVFCEAKLFPVV